MAFSAVKVMMVSFVGTFIAWRLSRDLHTADLALFLKGLECAVDSGDPESGGALQGKGHDLVWQEWMFLLGQDGLDGLLLAGCASFDGQDVTMPGRDRYFKPSTMAETLCLIMES
jgi:hypothetical protein